MKQTKNKKAIAILSVLLALVLMAVTWLTVAAVKNSNPVCLFGHDYGDDGKCIRCGTDKPLDEEHDEPQAFVSEAFTLYASGGEPSNPPSSNVPSNVPDGYRPVKVGDTIIGSKSIAYLVYVANVGSAHYDTVETHKILEFKNGKTLHIGIDGNDGWVGLYHSAFNAPFGDCPDDFSLLSWSEDDLNPIVQAGFATFRGSDFDEFGLTGEVSSITENYVLYINTNYQAVPPTAPAKEGYTFTGWYTDEACTNKYTEEYVTGDITLYAGFRAHTYSIKFNANSGSGNMANLSMTYDQSKNITVNTFTKEHYAFKGWATSPNGAVIYSNSQSVKNLTATDGAVIELFAVWERSEVNVNFVVEGKTTTTWVAIGTKATLPETPTKEGYLFVGWYFEDGTEYVDQDLTEDTVLTAKFSIIRCTVTFIVDGEVYAIYVCDWGTKLSEVLNANDVNAALLKVEGEYSRNF